MPPTKTVQDELSDFSMGCANSTRFDASTSMGQYEEFMARGRHPLMPEMKAATELFVRLLDDPRMTMPIIESLIAGTADVYALAKEWGINAPTNHDGAAP